MTTPTTDTTRLKAIPQTSLLEHYFLKKSLRNRDKEEVELVCPITMINTKTEMSTQDTLEEEAILMEEDSKTTEEEVGTN